MPFFDYGYFNSRTNRKLKPATIKKKIIAWKKNKEFYDGSRQNGYGGFNYDGRWLTILPKICLLYTSPSPRDGLLSRMPSSA